MAWEIVSVMEQRIDFVLEALRGDCFIKDLCRKYDISRNTGYKWINRFKEKGIEGLEDRSTRPHTCPHETSFEWKRRIVEVKMKYLAWGPKKIRPELEKLYEEKPPAVSTIGDILKRANLVKRKKRRAKKHYVNHHPLTVALYPNHVWAADFKGWFRTKDAARCEPLTISDLYSRKVIAVIALPLQLRRCFHPKCFMRSLFIELLPPLVESPLLRP